MEHPGLYLAILGALLILYSLVRTRRRIKTDRAVIPKNNDDVKRAPLKDANDFGQKIKWAVNIDEPSKKRPPGRTEPPTGKGR